MASLPPLSGGKLLFIRLRQEKDAVDLALPSSVQAGRYALKVRLVTADDYGVIRIGFNRLPLAQPVDGYTPEIDSKLIDLGVVDVRSETNTLRIEAVGRNPHSDGCYVGIDALILAPVQ